MRRGRRWLLNQLHDAIAVVSSESPHEFTEVTFALPITEMEALLDRLCELSHTHGRENVDEGDTS